MNKRRCCSPFMFSWKSVIYVLNWIYQFETRSPEEALLTDSYSQKFVQYLFQLWLFIFGQIQIILLVQRILPVAVPKYWPIDDYDVQNIVEKWFHNTRRRKKGDFEKMCVSFIKHVKSSSYHIVLVVVHNETKPYKSLQSFMKKIKV